MDVAHMPSTQPVINACPTWPNYGDGPVSARLPQPIPPHPMNGAMGAVAPAPHNHLDSNLRALPAGMTSIPMVDCEQSSAMAPHNSSPVRFPPSHHKQQHAAASQPLRSPSVSSSADFAQPQRIQRQQLQQQLLLADGRGVVPGSGPGQPMPPPFSYAQLRGGGAGAVYQRFPHQMPFPQHHLAHPHHMMPRLMPNFFVFTSEMANRAVSDVRRPGGEGQRQDGLRAWHMANIPPMQYRPPAVGCSKGPSTSFPHPAMTMGEGHVAFGGGQPQAAMAHMAMLTNSMTVATGGCGANDASRQTCTTAGTSRGTKRKSGNSGEVPRHKSASTPSPHFHSPLPQPLSVPTEAVLRQRTNNGASSVSASSFTDKQLDPAYTASCSGGIASTPGAEVESSLRCPMSEPFAPQQNGGSAISAGGSPGGTEDYPLKSLEMMTKQAERQLSDMSSNQATAKLPVEQCNNGNNGISSYAAALAEQHSKEQKLLKLDQIVQCLDSDLSPMYGNAGGEEVNGVQHSAMIHAQQLAMLPPSARGGGAPMQQVVQMTPMGPMPMRMPAPPMHPMHPSLIPAGAQIVGASPYGGGGIPPPMQAVYGPQMAQGPAAMNGGGMPPQFYEGQPRMPLTRVAPQLSNFPQGPHGEAQLPSHMLGKNCQPMQMGRQACFQSGAPQGPGGVEPSYLPVPQFPDEAAAGGMMAGCWPAQHQMPQPLNNLDSRVPVQKLQYFPASATMNNGGPVNLNCS